MGIAAAYPVASEILTGTCPRGDATQVRVRWCAGDTVPGTGVVPCCTRGAGWTGDMTPESLTVTA